MLQTFGRSARSRPVGLVAAPSPAIPRYVSTSGLRLRSHCRRNAFTSQAFYQRKRHPYASGAKPDESEVVATPQVVEGALRNAEQTSRRRPGRQERSRVRLVYTIFAVALIHAPTITAHAEAWVLR